MFVKQSKYTGFVVNIHNKSEYDMYVWIFTKQVGLKSFLVKGVKKINSKMLGKFDYMNWIEVECVEKDDEQIAVVTSVKRMINDNISWDYKIVHFISEFIYKACPQGQAYHHIYKTLEKYYVHDCIDSHIYLILFFMLNPMMVDIGYKFPSNLIDEYKVLLIRYKNKSFDENELKKFFFNVLEFIYYHVDIILYSEKFLEI